MQPEKVEPSASITDYKMAELLGDDYLEVNMGTLKEEERQFMIVDKDAGRVYDIRNERHVERLEEKIT